MRIDLSAVRSEFVLGEPVVLAVTVWNESGSDIPAWVDALSGQIEVWIARHDGPFAQYAKGVGAIPTVLQEVKPIPPGHRKVYVIRVLATFRAAGARRLAAQLAFPEAGEYAINARYPLYPDRRMFESNTIRIRVSQPTGVEAQIWAEINEPAFLHFLQTGEYWGDDREYALKAAKHLSSFPDSRYHSALRYALGEDYHRRRLEVPASGDVQQGDVFRRALGIDQEVLFDVPRAPPVLDHRLYLRRVAYHFPEYTPISEVLTQATQQTGVPLELGEGIWRTSRFRSGRKDVTLHEFMQTFVDPGRTSWVRDADGYRLVPIDKKE